MIEYMGLELSDQELQKVVGIVRRTRSIAPDEEIVSEFVRGQLTPGVLTFFLPRMWRNRPGDSPIPTEVWREMFQYALYTEDMRVHTRPRRSARAYRGATFNNREGLSWSLDVGQAQYFARSRQAPGETAARVWVTDIPANRMFARYMDGYEKEITADARGLNIYPLEDEKLLPAPRWRDIKKAWRKHFRDR